MRQAAGKWMIVSLAALAAFPLLGGALNRSAKPEFAEKISLRAPQQTRAAGPRLSMTFTELGFPVAESPAQRRLLWVNAEAPKRVSSWPLKVEPATPARSRTLVMMTAEAPLPPPRPIALDAADLKRLVAVAPTPPSAAARAHPSALARVADSLPFSRSVATAVSGLSARVASLVPDL